MNTARSLTIKGGRVNEEQVAWMRERPPAATAIGDGELAGDPQAIHHLRDRRVLAHHGGMHALLDAALGARGPGGGL